MEHLPVGDAPRPAHRPVLREEIHPPGQLTMERQAEGLRLRPNLMLIDDADRPAKWYFELKQALLESRRTGAPMKHPISDPVTLRWRS
jgi:hypothetical protein